MSASGKSLLGLWLYRTGEEWAIKDGDPEVIHIFNSRMRLLIINNSLLQYCTSSVESDPFLLSLDIPIYVQNKCIMVGSTLVRFSRGVRRGEAYLPHLENWSTLALASTGSKVRHLRLPRTSVDTLLTA